MLRSFVILLKSNILVQGLLITDWEALERLTDPHDADYRQSVKLTINAGIDMVKVELKLVLEENNNILFFSLIHVLCLHFVNICR